MVRRKFTKTEQYEKHNRNTLELAHSSAYGSETKNLDPKSSDCGVCEQLRFVRWITIRGDFQEAVA